MIVAVPAPLDAHGPARLLARPGVASCLAALATDGEETRLVGGCVRDALLGLDAADIDLATTHSPDRTMELGRAAGLKAVPTGYEHGTVTLVVDGLPFEVTTLREDIETDGRHAVVRFGRDFSRDAERRDFTINALSLGADGALHDTTGGLGDLAAGRVRFIGDAHQRIREDALRILRFFRFHARFGRGAPDEAGLRAATDARAMLALLSRERVRAELLKLLAARRAPEVVAAMSESGLLARLLPAANIDRLTRLAADSGSSAILRLAALSVRTRADAQHLGESLRLSKAEQATLIAYADALAAVQGFGTLDAITMRAAAVSHGPALLAGLLQALEDEPPTVLPQARQALADLLAGDPPFLPLTGADLVAHGIKPGRAVGRGLAAAREMWLAEGCPVGAEVGARLLARALEVARGERKPEPTQAGAGD